MKARMVLGRFWLFGLITGIVFSILITTVFTVMDWSRNFGGIFRDQSGTNWPIVYETAMSWFLPTLIYSALAASLGHLIVSGTLKLYRRYYSNNGDASNT